MKKTIILTSVLTSLIVALLFSREGLCNYSWTTLADFKGIDQFSLFLRGDFYYYRSDIEGKVAVKGDAYLKSFSIGKKAKKSDFTFIVNGKLNAGGLSDADGGEIYNGGVYAGSGATFQRVTVTESELISKGNVSLTQLTLKNSIEAEGDVTINQAVVEGDVHAKGSVTLLNGSQVHGTLTENDNNLTVNPPFDFNSVNLVNIANELYKDGTDIGVVDGKISINVINSGTYYFDINADDFGGNWYLFSINAPAESTIVIDIIGDPDDIILAYKDFKISGGITAEDIIFNFIDEDGNLTIEMHNNSQIYGSILAPGNIIFYDASIKGSIMAKNFLEPPIGHNSGQINVVPIPSTLLFLLSSLLIFSFRKSKKSDKKYLLILKLE